MKLHEVSPQLEVGQFWAHLSPLALCKLREIDKSDSNSIIGATVVFDAWFLEGTKRIGFIAPLGPDFRYLWVREYVDLDYFNFRPNPGDAVIDRMTGKIWFIGPSDQQDAICILSDELAPPPRIAERLQGSGV